MQRGLIYLNSQEVKILLKILENSNQAPFLKNKLEVSQQEKTENSSIQTTEEELETLLDNLPAPTPDVSDETKQLRKKITETLFEFRK